MPFGCGRPIWVDQPDFDLGRHLSQTVLPSSPGAAVDPDEASDERVLQIAVDLVCTPLPRHRPLWAARWVTDLAHDRAALILVMHHAMTDGVGGLAVLAALGDDGTIPVIDPFPQPPPPLRSVAAVPGGTGRPHSRLSRADSAVGAKASGNSGSGPGDRSWLRVPHSTGPPVRDAG